MQIPQTLYRYRTPMRHVLKEIENNEIYIPSLAAMNDPREGMIRFVPGDVERLRKLLPEARADHEKIALGDATAAIDRIQDHLVFGLLPEESVIQSAKEAMKPYRTYFRTLRKRWGVACFTPSPENDMMWWAYCHGHKGVVIEYDFGSVPLGRGAVVEVKYQDKPAVVTLVDVLDHEYEGQFVEVLAQKTRCWQGEQEWRIAINQLGLKPFGPQVKRVIAGLFTSNRFKSRLRKAVAAANTKRNANIVFARRIQSADGTIKIMP